MARDDEHSKKEVALAAVRDNGLALDRVPHGDRQLDVVLAALESNREAIYAVHDKKMFNDPRVCARLKTPGKDEQPSRTPDDMIGRRVANWIAAHYPHTAAATSTAKMRVIS